MSTWDAPDFFSLAPAPDPNADAAALFACSSSDDDGCGSLRITPDAVYLGEDDHITRIDVTDICSWSTGDHGRLFALTVECDDAHITYLVGRFRHATVTAMTNYIGAEGVDLRAA